MKMLNIGSQGGNFDNYCKFNSKAGRFYVKGANGDVEVVPTAFIADLSNIKTGWVQFVAGQAPSRTWDASLSTPAPQPSPDHKRGFSLRLFSQNTFGGVVEMSSSSMHLCAAINDLYTAYSAEAAKYPNQVPVVKFEGTTVQKDQKGQNYKPIFSIVKFVDRPAELDAAPAPQQQQGYSYSSHPQMTPPPAPVQAAPVNSASEF
jgi:hypothetical protein